MDSHMHHCFSHAPVSTQDIQAAMAGVCTAALLAAAISAALA